MLMNVIFFEYFDIKLSKNSFCSFVPINLFLTSDEKPLEDDK